MIPKQIKHEKRCFAYCGPDRCDCGVSEDQPMSDPATQISDIWAGTTFETHAERKARLMSGPTTAETPTMRTDQAESIRRVCSRLHDEARVLEVEIACKSRALEETRAQYDALQQMYNDFLNEPKD